MFKMILQCLIYSMSLYASSSLLHEVDGLGRLPIHVACEAGKNAIVKWIIETDPSFLWKKDKYERLPAHLLLDKASFSELLFYHWYGYKGDDRCSEYDSNFELLKWMLSHDKALLEFKNKHGDLLIHHAYPELVQWMVEIKPSLLYEKSAEGFLPIHLVLQSGAGQEVAKWMVNQDKSLLWEKDSSGKLPIHMPRVFESGGYYHFPIASQKFLSPFALWDAPYLWPSG